MLPKALIFIALLIAQTADLDEIGQHVPIVARPRNVGPEIILWAWERPEYLRFINPKKPSVAFLAGSVRMQGSKILVRGRMQPLQVPANTNLIAVIRIEANPVNRDLSSGRAEELAAKVEGLFSVTRKSALQIDFDARKSEREFYRQFLAALHRRLGPSVTISITALPSWCSTPSWLSGLNVADAVPMTFRMGADRTFIMSMLSHGGDFTLALCRASIGVSLDEPLPAIPPRQKVFIFSPRPWTVDDFNKAVALVSGR